MIAFVRSVAERAAARPTTLLGAAVGRRLTRLTRPAGSTSSTRATSPAASSSAAARAAKAPSAYADVYTMRRNGRRSAPLVAGAGSAYVEDVTPTAARSLFRRDQGLWVKRIGPGERAQAQPTARRLEDQRGLLLRRPQGRRLRRGRRPRSSSPRSPSRDGRQTELAEGFEPSEPRRRPARDHDRPDHRLAAGPLAPLAAPGPLRRAESPPPGRGGITAAWRDPAIGSTLGGYRLDALIARGGMGVVYRATHLALDRPVALKVIARHLADDEGFRERFLRESRLAARLDHPNVVPVFDAREEDGELIVAMRLVEGGDLKQRIAAEGPLPPAEAVELLGQVAAALDAAHAAGIVHRDVKPHNILLEGDRAYLTDFGLAKALGDSGVLSGTSIVGTVEYMSPEQWRGESVGPAADVYSLGCVLYEALTGIVPYARQAGDTEPEMPEGLDAVIERAVAKDPADRYPTAGRADRSRPRARGRDARRRPGSSPTRPDRPTRRSRGGARGWRRPRSAGAGRRAAGSSALVARRALAVVALAAIFLLGGGGVSVSAPIAVGQRPAAARDRPRSVWVTSARDGTLTRIDPATGAVDGPPLHLGRGIAGRRRRRRLGLGLRARAPARSCASTATPASVEQRIDVGGRPGAIVFGGDRVWVADEDGGRRDRDQRRRRAGLQARHRPARGAAAARRRRRRRLGQQRRRPAPVRRIDLGTARRRRRRSTSAAAPPGSRSAAASSGSRTAAPTASPGSTRRPARCSARRSRSAAAPAGSTPAPSVVWVANAGRRHGQPDRHRKRRDGRRPDRRRPPPGRRRGRRGSGLGRRQRRRLGNPDRAVNRNQ